MKYGYICAPYRATCEAEKERNIKRVQQFAKELYKKGILPIFTHGTYEWLPETEENRNKILNLCFKLIDICDIIYVLRKDNGKGKVLSEIATSGMIQEIMYAKSKKKKIIYI